jgi:hypothetical protein
MTCLDSFLKTFT